MELNIKISEELYLELLKKAQELGITVDELVVCLLQDK